jgi:hypothetical protein
MESTKESMKKMMESIFCYGVLSKDNRYLNSYREKLSEKEFNEIYDEYSKYLSDTFTIEYNTYTDYEGCTYNSLIKKS